MIRSATSIWLWTMAGAVAAATEPAERSEPPRLLAEGVGTTAIGLVVVLLLIMLLAWAVKRFGRLPMASRGAVQIIGGVSLGTREKAVLLSVQGTRLLVGVAPGQVRTLHVLSGEQDDAEGGQDFQHQLQSAQRGQGA